MANGHKGNLGTCPKLQELFELLLQRPHTTAEIHAKTKMEAISSRCSEIRRSLEQDDLPMRYKGYSMPKAEYKGLSDSGCKVFSYEIERIQTGQQSFLETGFSGSTAILK